MATSQTGPWALLRPLAYTSTAFVGFNMAATSIIFVPALLRTKDTQQERSTATKLFSSVNQLSMKYNIPLEILSMVAYGTLAYRAHYRDGTDAWKGWVAAVGIIGSIFPLKNLFMAPVAKAVVGKNLQEREFEVSLQKWSILNLLRSGIVLGAGVVAAVFDEC